jgi:translocation and assembly module TamB
MNRRTARIFSWLLAAPLVVAVVASLVVWRYAQTDEFRSFLHERLFEAVRDSIEGEVALGELSGSIWSGLRLDGVSIRQRGEEVVSARALIVRLSPLRQAVAWLFSSRWHIASLEVIEPAIHAIEREDGRWNLAELLKAADGDRPAGPELSLHRIALSDGRVAATLASGLEVRLGSLSLEGRARFLRSGRSIEVARVELLSRSAGIPDARWRGSVSYDDTSGVATIRLRSLALRTAGSELRLSGSAAGDPVRLDLEAELPRLAADEVRVLFPGVPLRADLAGAIAATGPLAALELRGRLKASGGSLAVAATLDASRPRLPYRATLVARDLPVERLFHVAGFAGRVSGRASLAGAGPELSRASAQGRLAAATVGDWKLGTLAFSASFAGREIAFAARASDNGIARLSGKVSAAAPIGYRLELEARDVDVRKAASDPRRIPAATRLSLDLRLRGEGLDLEKAQARGSLSLLPSRVGPLSVSGGDLAATLRRGRLTVEKLTAAGEEARVDAAGEIDLAGRRTVRLAYRVRAGDLARWLALAGLEGRGSLDAEGELRGTLESLTAEGKARASEIGFGGVSAGAATFQWFLSDALEPAVNGRIAVRAADVKTPVALERLDLTARLAGRSPLDARGEIVARDRMQRSHRLAARVQHAGASTRISLESVALESPRGVWRSAGAAGAVLREKRLSLERLELRRDASALAAEGLVALEGAQEFRVEWRRVPLGEIRDLFSFAVDVSGATSGELEVRGTARAPVVAAKLRAEPFVVSGQSYGVLEGSASYAGKRAAVALELRQDALHSLSARGEVPLALAWEGGRLVASPGELDLRLRSQGLSIALLAPLVPQVEKLQGTLSLEIALRGPLRSPAPRGWFELEGARGRIRPLGLSLTGVRASGRVAPGKAHLDRIAARSGPGELTGSGELELDGFGIGRLRLALEARDFGVIDTREYQAGVSGRLRVAGTADRPAVSGELTVTRASLRPDIAALGGRAPDAPDPTIVVAKNEAELESLRAAEKAAPRRSDDRTKALGFYEALALDLAVRVPRGTWVRPRDGEIEIAGEVRLRKERGGDPTLTGEIRSVRGWYAFHGRKFQITKGEILFTGGPDIDPGLRIAASHKAPPYRIDMLVGGSLNKPTLALRSEPSLEEGDILSVLLFGKPVKELDRGERVDLQAQALKATSEFVASGLRQSVARRLGVDTLEVGFGEDPRKARVEVGKYVSRDVFVSAAQEFGETQGQQYSIEYHLSPNWQLKSSTNSRGETGIDLFWRREY